MNYHNSDMKNLSVSSQSQSGLKPHLTQVPCGDQSWRLYTQLANEAFKAGDMSEAKEQYVHAFNEAETLFEAALITKCNYSAPMIYNISCHNCAAFVATSGEYEVALDYYFKAYNRLLTTAQAIDVLPKLRLACIQHLKIALIALVNHLAIGQNNEQKILALQQDAAHSALKVFYMLEHIHKADQDCPHCFPI